MQSYLIRNGLTEENVILEMNKLVDARRPQPSAQQIKEAYEGKPKEEEPPKVEEKTKKETTGRKTSERTVSKASGKKVSERWTKFKVEKRHISIFVFTVRPDNGRNEAEVVLFHAQCSSQIAVAVVL